MTGTTRHLLLHRVDGYAAVISTIHLFKAILIFSTNLRTEDIRCSATMNVSAFVSLSWMPKIPRPTHAKGEFEHSVISGLSLLVVLLFVLFFSFVFFRELQFSSLCKNKIFFKLQAPRVFQS